VIEMKKIDRVTRIALLVVMSFNLFAPVVSAQAAEAELGASTGGGTDSPAALGCGPADAFPNMPVPGEEEFSFAEIIPEGEPAAPALVTDLNGIDPWQLTTPLPELRRSHGMVQAGGNLYVVGGDDGAEAVFSTVISTTIATGGALESWQEAEPLNVRRTRAGAVVSGDYLYAIGGSDGTATLTSVEVAQISPDGTLSPWTNTSALNLPRAGAAAVVAGDHLYVIGGETTDGSLLGSVEVAQINPDGSLGVWLIETYELGTPRRDAVGLYAPGPAMDYLYVLGGASPITSLNTVEKAKVNLDGSLGAWSKTTGMLYNRERLAGVFYMGYLFAFGGETLGDYTLASVEYAPVFLDGTGEIGEWLPTSSLKEDRAGLAVAATSGRVYATGGYADGGMRATTERSLIEGQIVIPGPRLDQVKPSGGPNHIGNTITLEGHSFVDFASASIGNTPLNGVNVINAAKMTGTVPSGMAPGLYDVVVVNPDGQSAVLAGAYEVVEGQGEPGEAPLLTSISPTSGSNAADIEITLIGEHFTATTAVQLGDVPLAQVIFDSAIQLRATIPEGFPPGEYDVLVINPDGQRTELEKAFLLSAGNGTWRFLEGRMLARHGGGAGVLDGFLYAVAGEDGGNYGRLHEVYDPTQDDWYRRMDYPGTGGRFLPGLGIASGEVYVFGGQSLTHGSAQEDAFVFDPDSGIWQSIAPYPLPAFGLAVTSTGDQVYLFGGEQPAPGSGPGTQYNNGYLYMPEADAYVGLSPMPVGVSRAVALAHKNKIYVIGGYRQGRAYAGVQVYDLAAGTWEMAAPLPGARAEAVGVVLNGKLYLIGGHDGQRVHRTVFEYDPQTDNWGQRTPLTVPRSGAFGGVIEGKIYVAGGRPSLKASNPVGSVEVGDFGSTPDTPALYVSEATHDFGELETSWIFDIANLGDGTLTWDIAESPEVGWLSVAPPSGSNAGSVTVSIARDGLAAGDYESDLAITSNGGEANVHVGMAVVEEPKLGVSPNALVFNLGDAGKMLQITNLAGGTLNWELTADADWVESDLWSGTGNADLTISVDVSGLGDGENTTWLRVTSNGGAADVQITAYKENPPVLTVLPTSLDFGTGLDSLAFEVLNGGGGLLQWSVSTEAEWISLGRESGGGDGSVQVSVSREGRPVGENSGTITVSGHGQEVTVEVKMTVEEQPILGVSEVLLDLGSSTDSASFEVRNDGGGVLDWSISEDLAWCWVEPTQGENTGTVTVYVDRSTESSGEKSGDLTVNSDYGTQTVQVKMTVPVGPVLGVSPTDLDFGTQLATLDLSISNTGDETLTWSITGKPTWITLSKTSGTDDAVIQVTVLRDQLSIGTKTATLTVQGEGNAGTKSVSISVIKQASPKLDVSPSVLDFGKTSETKSFTVYNSGGGTLSWQVTDNKSWIRVSPASGTNQGTVNVTVDRDGMSAGEHSGTVTVTGGGQTKTVVISMVVEQDITQLSVGNVTVYADNFEHLGGDKYKATGNVRFNSRGKLSRTGDYAIVDEGEKKIYGNGTVAFVTTAGTVEVFKGEYYVLPYDGKIKLKSLQLVNLLLDEVATYDIKQAMDFYVDISENKIVGKVSINFSMPGNYFQETVSFSYDYRYSLSGSIQDLVFDVDGLKLRAEDITIKEDGLYVRNAYLEFPTSLGGQASGKIKDLVISDVTPYFELDSAFEVSNIKFGGPTGFEIQYARLELAYKNREFRFAGEGTFVFKSFLTYGQCRLDVEFEIYSLDNWSGGFMLTCSTGVPIGSTGFFITGLGASVTFRPTEFEVSLTVEISGGPKVPLLGNAYLVSGDPTLYLKKKYDFFELGVEGDLRILKWDIAHGELYFRKSGDWAGVHGEIDVEINVIVVVHGNATVDIWKDYSGAHFNGQGLSEIILPKGVIWDGWPNIPPKDITLFSQNIAVGEFTDIEPGKTVYGIRVGIDTWWWKGSIFLDAQGKLKILGGKFYQSGLRSAAAAPLAERGDGTRSETIDVEVGATDKGIFVLGWDSGSPSLTLTDPNGRLISETLQAGDVLVMRLADQVFINVRDPISGTWHAQVGNLSGSENYELVVFQSNIEPQVVVHTPTAASESVSGAYQIQWEVEDPDNPETKVDLYYAASETGTKFPIAEGLPLSQTSYRWDTSGVPTGEYLIYAEASNGDNAPVGDYSVGTVEVENLDAPESPEISSFDVDREDHFVQVEWSAVEAPDLEGYRVYYGYESGDYIGVMEVGADTSAYLFTPDFTRSIYVMVNAFDSSGNESPFVGERGDVLEAWNIYLPVIMSNPQ
jgi:N-acetylneuraminic acid mutarotase